MQSGCELLQMGVNRVRLTMNCVCFIPHFESTTVVARWAAAGHG